MARKNISREVEIAAGQNIKEYRYWMEKLAGEPEKSRFPFDYKKKVNNETERACKTFRFADDLFTGLNKLGKGSSHTLHIVLLAALTALLGKYTGKDDILIGTPIYRQETEDEFINTMLVIRNRLQSAMTFKDLLMQVKQAAAEAVAHQAYPVELLPDRLGMPTTDTGADNDFPLFDVVLLLCDIHDRTYLRALTPSIIFLIDNNPQYIEVEVEYNALRCRPDTIDRIISHFRRLLAQGLRNPDAKLCDIEILSEEERKQLLFDFNDTCTAYPKDRTLRQLFEEQAEKNPHHTALIGPLLNDPGKYESNYPISLTYRELDRKAAQAAASLIKRGVGADVIVGLMMERSIEMIIAVFGILKAGGAYLPIDRRFPVDRIAYMLSDSGARVLLTAHRSFKEGERVEKWEGEVLFIEEIETGVAAQEPILNYPEDLAYIIYTSGTTGKPKGTLTTHYNVVRVVKNTNYIDIKETDRVMQLSNVAFDGSVFDVFGALLNGASLVLVGEDDVLDIDRLSGFIKKEAITVFFITTALFNALVDLRVEGFANIRKVLFGGERVSVEHAEKALEYMGQDRIIHMYGPTETTVYATYYTINRINERLGTIPIGKPTANTTLYILDRFLESVPVGVQGEVYIGGDGVARGYLNHPELTAEKFIDLASGPTAWRPVETQNLASQTVDQYRRGEPCVHPSILSNSQLIYRTGDLARWLPGGSVEFVGRIDHQVKIRGFRIELGEIEDILLRYDGIKDAVVVDWEKEPGQKSLCAYVVPVGEIDAVAVREYLAKELPEFMIPAYVTLLEKVPLTGNGKLDRKKLPAPQLNIGSDYAAPRNDNEKLVADIWMEVLGLDKVGIHHNFFDLGGNSIDFIKLNSKLKEELKKDIPLTMMFRYPTIATFVRYLSEETYSLVIDRSTEKKLGTNRLEKMRNLKRRGIAK